MYYLHLPNRVVHYSPALFCQLHVIAVCFAAWLFFLSGVNTDSMWDSDKMIIRDVSDNYSWRNKSFHNWICAEMLQGQKFFFFFVFFLSPQLSKLCFVVLKINNGNDARIGRSRHFPFCDKQWVTGDLVIHFGIKKTWKRGCIYLVKPFFKVTSRRPELTLHASLTNLVCQHCNRPNFYAY